MSGGLVEVQEVVDLCCSFVMKCFVGVYQTPSWSSAESESIGCLVGAV